MYNSPEQARRISGSVALLLLAGVLTVLPGKTVKQSHGRPRPMKMLNTLPPRALEMAALPKPCLATTMLAKTLGNEVPAAAKTMPTKNALSSTSGPSSPKHSVITNAKKAK